MSLTGVLVMMLIGVFLSAFFSGSETGFYRIARVRLVLDSRAGSRIARGLLWLTNNPSLFVATTLIGNNLANYITSLSIVMLTQLLFEGSVYLAAAELMAPIAAAPALFVYGELFPKYLFYHAPNTLLHRAGPLFLVFTIVFAPISALLWALGRAMRSILGESFDRIRLTLARAELARVFEEGHAAGILNPIQQQLAQGLFRVAGNPALQFATPAGRVTSVPADATREAVLRLAQRTRFSAIAVRAANEREKELIGYVRIVDLCFDKSPRINVRPLPKLPHKATQVVALTRLQERGEAMARLVDDNGKTVAIVTANRLIDAMLRDD
jgi:putative hemolysin